MLKTSLNRNHGFYYISTLIIIIALSFLGIEFESIILKYICYGIYFLYALYFSYYVYNRKFFQQYERLIMFVPFIYFFLLFIDKILSIPFILVYVVVAMKKINPKFTKIVTITLYTLILVIGIFIFVIGGILNDFSSEKVERTYYSPNKQNRVTVISVDLGATGGGTKAYIEKSYFGLFKTKRKIFVGRYGEFPTIRWVDNKSVRVNEELIKAKW